MPVFGAFFSGIGYFSDTGPGIPYVWSLFAAALFAWLLSRSRRRPSGSAVSAFCFVGGMVSSWFWFFDGSEFMLIALIGLIGWFGSSHLEPRARFLRVTGFMALFVGGFVACYTLILMTRFFVHEMFVLGEARDPAVFAHEGGFVARNLYEGVVARLYRIVGELWRGLTLLNPWRIPIVSNYLHFEIMTMAGGMSKAGIRIVALLSLFSAMAAGCLAMLRAEAGIRGRPDLLWLLGLMGIVSLHFLLPTDIIFLESRWMFLLLALSWSCLIAVLTAGTGAHERLARWPRLSCGA